MRQRRPRPRRPPPRLPTSVLTPITNLLTTAPTTDAPAATTATATTTPTATSVTDPITNLLTPAPTTAPSATTTPTTTTSPATILPNIPTLVPSATTGTPSTTSTPSTTDAPVTLIPTLIPSTDTPATLTPLTDTPVTLTPVTDIPVTLTPSTDTPSTETPSTETPSTATPSTETPSTETPSTETPSTDTPSKTDEPSTSSSSDSSGDDITESPPPVTATPSGSGEESPSPVTKTPSATKSPIAIETNSGSEDEQDASAQKDQTQSDVIMYNASATPITATSGSSDRFAIPDDTTKTEKPVVLNIAGDAGESGSEDLVTYVRGKTAASDAAATTNANVIGGRNTYVDTTDSDVLSSSAAAFHEFLRYASVAFAGISVALLLFFHFVSLDANLLWVNAAWSPNTWEFLFYVGYLQQMQATSELTLLKTPYFLWDYTDSFAWSNFLIQDSSSDSTQSRRLETIVLGGLVSYADRIGITEESILNHGATGFAVIMGVLIVVFLVLAVMAKRKAERALDESSDLNRYTSGVHRLRSVSIRALGLCVLVWYFALFPLSMLASFEISMEVQSSTVADSLVVAIIALVLVCFGVLAVAGRVIMHKTKDELEQFENLATWGSLYCEYTYRSRMFFVIDVVVQITTGILVGCMSGDPTQLIVVMGIQALYLACVFIVSPFADQMVLRITYVLGLLKILNFGLAFAFLNSNTMSATARTRVAQAYIGINSIVILVWFVRQLIVFSTYIRAWMVRSNDDSRRSDSIVKYDPQTDTESDLWASQFTAGNDSRYKDSRVNQSDGTLSLPAGSSVQSMQPSFPGSTQTSYGQASSQQSMAPSFGSEVQFQQQMARKRALAVVVALAAVCAAGADARQLASSDASGSSDTNVGDASSSADSSSATATPTPEWTPAPNSQETGDSHTGTTTPQTAAPTSDSASSSMSASNTAMSTTPTPTPETASSRNSGSSYGPSSTTRPPESTTRTPESATQMPESTTQTPESTTRTPESTTQTPESTTRTPEATTQTPWPESTTQGPWTNSPESTTQGPWTNAPEPTTQTPTTGIGLSLSGSNTGVDSQTPWTSAPESTTHTPTASTGSSSSGSSGITRTLSPIESSSSSAANSKSDSSTGSSTGSSSASWTSTPTEVPTQAPTTSSSGPSTESFTNAPTTDAPTEIPTEVPTEAPTDLPAQAPTTSSSGSSADPFTNAPTHTEAPTTSSSGSSTESFTNAPTTDAPTEIRTEHGVVHECADPY
ncbi:unnamed protein product [Phytophthora lilii]|uniref:Unnamed protein product n=1 Tax=Phytophthora lilii TaxID=2077276 RepID=A0A9W6XBY4_9STRA|nr:unnamed protein product [Phytophthora lilii]